MGLPAEQPPRLAGVQRRRTREDGGPPLLSRPSASWTIDLDIGILTVPGQERRVVIFTAEPDSPAYRSLQLLKVIGTQRMTAET